MNPVDSVYHRPNSQLRNRFHATNDKRGHTVLGKSCFMILFHSLRCTVGSRRRKVPPCMSSSWSLEASNVMFLVWNGAYTTGCIEERCAVSMSGGETNFALRQAGLTSDGNVICRAFVNHLMQKYAKKSGMSTFVSPQGGEKIMESSLRQNAVLEFSLSNYIFFRPNIPYFENKRHRERQRLDLLPIYFDVVTRISSETTTRRT